MRRQTKRNVQGFVVSLSVITIFVLVFTVTRNFSTSYAINTGVDSSGVINTTFTTNYSSSSTNNYIKSALGSAQSSYTNNFDVPSNLLSSKNSTPLYKLMKNASTPATTESFEIISGDTPSQISDNGIKYILAQGYNSSNTSNNIFASGTYGSVTDNNIKQYITQIALWLYIYENSSSFSDTYCKDFSDGTTSYNNCAFYDTSSNVVASSTVRNIITSAASVSNYNYLNYIIALVDGAKSYTGNTTSTMTAISGSSLNYSINSSFTLLTTDAVTPASSSNTANYMYYSIEITDPNNYGVYITNTNGTKITSLDVMSGSFKVAVPLKSDITSMDLSTIKITVYGHYMNPAGYDYRVTSTTLDDGKLDKHDNYSDVLLGYVPTEVVSTNFNLYNFTKISKVDAANSNELPGASLVIKNTSTDKEVESWTSTDTPHYVYLPNGSYELCETLAPDGYQTQTECITFTVDGSKVSSVTMENATIPTENTSIFSSKILYIVGSILIISGGGALLIISRKQKQSNLN